MFVPQNSGSQTAPEPQLHQDGQGGHNQAVVIQGNDNKINLPNDKDNVDELIQILELRRMEFNRKSDAYLKLYSKKDADFMLQLQKRYNGLMDDLIKAELRHQFMLAHEITIKIHLLGNELENKKNKRLEEIKLSIMGSLAVFQIPEFIEKP